MAELSVAGYRAGGRARVGAGIVSCIVILALCLSGNALAAAPAWQIVSVHAPTNVPNVAPGADVDYDITPINVGAVATDGTITVTDELPTGVTTVATPNGEGWSCTPTGPDKSVFSCTSTTVVNPDSEAERILIEAYLPAGTVGEGMQITNHVTITGGGTALAASTQEAATVSSTPAPFGVQSFIAQTFNGSGGEPFTQAAGHPYAATSIFHFNTVLKKGAIAVAGNVKDVDIKLPVGFLGDPEAIPRCTAAEVAAEGAGGLGQAENLAGCSAESQVGTITVYIHEFTESPKLSKTIVPVYNLVPAPGVPAEFGFSVYNVPIRLEARVVREGGAYELEVVSPDVSEAFEITGVSLTLWGVPAESSHTAEREEHDSRGALDKGPLTPFLTNPSDCATEAGMPPTTTISVDSWENPEAFTTPLVAASPAVTGCNVLSFDPSISFAPRSSQADQPSGYSFSLEVPQSESPVAEATPDLRNATVTLPEGVSVSPSAAEGLVACSDQEIGFESIEAGSCPSQSRIGTAHIETPLLAEELTGSVFLGQPECSPCSSADAEDGKIFRLFIEVAGSGVVIKLPGTVSANPSTGRLSATFVENPQLPFERLELSFDEGPRAPLSTPQSCGTFTTTSTLTSWGAPETPVASPVSQFVTTGCSSAFSPAFSAGTISPVAGSYSPFVMSFARRDGEEDLSGVGLQLPPGLLGKLAGIPRCAEAQANEGSCGAESLIGTTTVDVGAGSSPLALSGRVYLTGPYDGDPFGLSILVPADAGPFDFGNVVVRASIAVNPRTAALTVTSGRFPQIIDGVQTRIQRVVVDINRAGFTLNPTSCESESVHATIASAQGGSAVVASPFTAIGCGKLAFAPKLTATTSGKASRKSGASLDVKIEFPREGGANIRRVRVQLPKRLPDRQATLKDACSEASFDANPASCQASSVVGHAKALTPLLAAPLEGPVYFVSHAGAKFPEVVTVLQGEGVAIELAGETHISAKGVITSTFASIPDAPVTTFELDLSQGDNSVLAAPGGKLCQGTLSMPTLIDAQDGAAIERDTRVAVSGCAKKPGKNAKKDNRKGRKRKRTKIGKRTASKTRRVKH